MALTDETEARAVAKDLLAVRRDELVRLDQVRSYVRGTVCNIYTPKRHRGDYKLFVEMALTNIVPTVVSTFAENLFIEGFRPARKAQNAQSWTIWQANRMDARQSGLFRSSLEYGLAYTTTLPGRIDGERSALIKPYSPRCMTAVYDDPINDEWPVYALAVQVGYDKELRKQVRRLVLLDDGYEIRMTAAVDSDQIAPDIKVNEHGLGVCPVVRWQSAGGDLDDQPRGEVEPLMQKQDELNNTTFGLLTTQKAQGFPQRYATGMEVQEDVNGNPIEPFTGGADKMMVNKSPDGGFGQFPAAPLDGYLQSRQSTLRIITAIAQMAPHSLLVSDGITNLSAEALAALEAAQQRKVAEMKVSLGEAAEQMLRLASKAAGDNDGWKDRSAQVVWRDTESRSLAQVADALGKMAQMLSIPPRALWERIPGVTETDLVRWEQLAKEEDGLAEKAVQEAQDAMRTQQDRMPDMPMNGAGGMRDVVPAGPARTARTPVPAGR